MIKKYILAIIAIALAVWVGFFFGKKEASAPEAPINEVAVEQVPAAPATSPAVKKTTTTAIVPKTTTATSPAMTKDGSYIVYYTNSGFSPATITIKVGKSVHFVNSGNKAMSLTSTSVDNQAQSEFNQGKTVGKGGTYDFTFMGEGSWGYMNRNNQTDKGVIVVVR